MNPVIPGDHPDCTVSKIGNDFYTTGSSFNPTPVIYHSTDLVHWEAIAQPVSAAWPLYGDAPAGGCWGGQVVYHGNKYWDFFSRSNTMYFVTADDVRGPWSTPTQIATPAGVPGLGYDNSIFIDDDGSWYLLVKNGQVNNWIVQLGENGQPAGRVLDLTWLNPSPSYPFSWAEGPVMWKYHGSYYYSFALNVAGGQKVFRSDSLTDDQASWTNLGDLFDLSDPLATAAVFRNPNHASAAVMLDDSTSWVVHPLWRSGNNNEWYGQGRQGLLNQIRYDANGTPTAEYPVNTPKTAPKLPSSGIPWMVPHADFFYTSTLNPEWSFVGYTASNTHSLTIRPGWLTLIPATTKATTVVKNDAEHNYSLITKMAFSPHGAADQAGLWVFNGHQTKYVKLCATLDSTGSGVVSFGDLNTVYTVGSPAQQEDSTLWLRLVRVNHTVKGYASEDGFSWMQIGDSIDVTGMDNQQPDYNSWTGNRQGLFVQGTQRADFDYYIYRDAYTPILAECPANQYGTTASVLRNGIRSLTDIHSYDWALYAGIEFGIDEYAKAPDSVSFTVSSTVPGGMIEVWLDSLDSWTELAECPVPVTGSLSSYTTVSKKLLTSVSGMHDVYLRFTGPGSGPLFNVQWMVFTNSKSSATDVNRRSGRSLNQFELRQNYPNPFNPSTSLVYELPAEGHVVLTISDALGREVSRLVDDLKPAGTHRVTFDGTGLSSGLYFSTLRDGTRCAVRKMLLLR